MRDAEWPDKVTLVVRKKDNKLTFEHYTPSFYQGTAVYETYVYDWQAHDLEAPEFVLMDHGMLCRLAGELNELRKGLAEADGYGEICLDGLAALVGEVSSEDGI